MAEKSPKIVCPTCRKNVPKSSVSYDVLPFCNKRCKMIDLGKWLNEKYVVVGEETAEKIPDEE